MFPTFPSSNTGYSPLCNSKPFSDDFLVNSRLKEFSYFSNVFLVDLGEIRGLTSSLSTLRQLVINVISRRPEKQVIGVHAVRVVTRVEDKEFRPYPVCNEPHGASSLDLLSVSTREANAPSPVCVETLSSPPPAIIAILDDVPPEPCSKVGSSRPVYAGTGAIRLRVSLFVRSEVNFANGANEGIIARHPVVLSLVSRLRWLLPRGGKSLPSLYLNLGGA